MHRRAGPERNVPHCGGEGCRRADEPNDEPARLGDVARSSLSYEKAERVLGWTPLVPLDEGVARTVEYFRNEPGRE